MSTLSYAREREKDREREKKIEIAGLYYRKCKMSHQNRPAFSTLILIVKQNICVRRRVIIKMQRSQLHVLVFKQISGDVFVYILNVEQKIMI